MVQTGVAANLGPTPQAGFSPADDTLELGRAHARGWRLRPSATTLRAVPGAYATWSHSTNMRPTPLLVSRFNPGRGRDQRLRERLGDQPGAAVEGEVRPGPLDHHEYAVAETD